MTKFYFFFVSLVLSNLVLAVDPIKLKNFSEKLAGKENLENNQDYNQMIQENIAKFNTELVEPIREFSQNNLKVSGKSLFYPFAGGDISNALLFFPDLENYVLVGLEFAGDPEIINQKFDLSKFSNQVENYLTRGFFKTMNMSADMTYKQGVIPIIISQISVLGGQVTDINSMFEPFRGTIIDFKYNNQAKRAYYFRANLNDHIDKSKFFEFLKEKKLFDNCMLKASSYKLQQVEFKQMKQFVLDNCSLILQDDTGIAVKTLKKNYHITLFGNYLKPYGDEFVPYYQKELAQLYQKQNDKYPIKFCYGYGCRQVEANILLATKISPCSPF